MRKNEIAVSVIIPAYNVEAYIQDCLQSIVDDDICSSGQIEVIIIDDGSTDSSAKIAETYAANYNFIRVVHQANSGVAYARNVGIREAKGKWLYFVDPDDWLAEHALTVLYEKCQQYQDVDIFLFDAYQNMPQKENQWEHFSHERFWREREEIEALQRNVLYYPYPSEMERTQIPLAAPWDKLYRKEFLMKHCLQFRENLRVLDDMVFNMEAFEVAEKVYYSKEKIYHYRYVESSITNSYKKDRVEKDVEVWEYIGQYAKNHEMKRRWTSEEKSRFMQAFYCRMIKSFSICCRLQFFNKANKQGLLKKIKYVESVLKAQPYHEAFIKVNLKNLEWKLKVVALFGRLRWGGGIYLLNLAECIIYH